MAKTLFVSSTTVLSNILSKLTTASRSPPSLYIDLEGVKLSRNGTVSLLSLYDHPARTVYLIDIHELGSSAFSTTATISPDQDTTSIPCTLKSVLESDKITKVFFDLRNDSDALFAHFNVKLQGVQDLQLMELASRQGSKARVAGLARSIQDDLSLSATAQTEIQKTKNAGMLLFTPERGGSYDIFNKRPLSPEIEKYCVQDVVHMPALWQTYNARLNKMSKLWRLMAVEGTEKRVADSQSEDKRPDRSWKGQGWNWKQIKEAQNRWKNRQAVGGTMSS
jgi:exonuclease 3'-5' domain-containing protein 1